MKIKKKAIKKKTPAMSKPVISLFDKIIEGREFESIVSIRSEHQNSTIDVTSELRKCLNEISKIRKRPIICYAGNYLNQNLKSSSSIDYNDDLPFTELVNTVPADSSNVDVVLVTPGGSANQVAKFVHRLREKFNHVAFILPDIAMSAGTIFAMSGDEIIMDSRSYLGPIDPQVVNNNGRYVPAQSILTLLKLIQERGQKELESGRNPMWTDLQILRLMDPKDIGSAENQSRFSEELVETFLYQYKFRTWITHSSNGSKVEDHEKKKRAKEIAKLLCNHEVWKDHGRGIDRDSAWNVCRLKIDFPEETEGLQREMRRFWALCHWIFENMAISKMFLSKDYCIFKGDMFN